MQLGSAAEPVNLFRRELTANRLPPPTIKESYTPLLEYALLKNAGQRQPVKLMDLGSWRYDAESISPTILSPTD
jgi:hypothetical protein